MARTKQTARDSKKASKKTRPVKAVKKTTKSVKNALKSAGGIKKPRRNHPGTVAKREIRRLQEGKDKDKKLIPRIAVDRLARELAQKSTGLDLRWQGKAIDALHEALEAKAVQLFTKTQDLNELRKRVGITPESFQKAAIAIFGENYFTAQPKDVKAPSVAKAKASKKVTQKKPAQKKPVHSSSSSSSSSKEEDEATVDTRPESERTDAAVDGVDDSAMDQDVPADAIETQ